MSADPMTEPELPRKAPIELLTDLEKAAGFPIRPEYVEGMVVIPPQADDNHNRGAFRLAMQLALAGFEEAGSGNGFASEPSGGKVRSLVVPDFYVQRRRPSDLDEAFRRAHQGWYPIQLLALAGEITSSNHETDTGPKYRSYAEAGVDVYVVVHRQQRKVYVFSDPVPGERRYDTVTETSLGHKVRLPAPYPVLDSSVCGE
jgi:Uma2 family endonuclease